FAIIADETTDVSGIEQFSICIRYVDRFENEEKLREDFLCFVPVEDTTGSGLANVLIDKLKELKLSFAHIRGQGYDGARSMSGHVKGCASVIQNLYPAALCVHCANHSLNLAIATTCKIPAIRNCIGSMKESANFFRMSTKASTLLKYLILESFPNSKQQIDSDLSSCVAYANNLYAEISEMRKDSE
ncbi:52 kDa repressor of the inhibitor of the protein kinase-like, partial [Bactrocera neohumeralis]|uniref:52 kDa repressor of the inhibitor of the protein kinase-like n=1 Tax=Bactrocera neohumeralis TaxID=98809 RepID=UPI002166012F